MRSDEREPTRDELLAMAYADGELDPSARAEFERRLASEPALSREVRDVRALAVLARQVAPPEPQDAEWERLERDLLQRLLHRGGFTLFSLGALATLALVLLRSFGDASWDGVLVPSCVCCWIAGGAALLVAALRWRRRTLQHDPYTDVLR
jgi:anti-sigma factor RsiW